MALNIAYCRIKFKHISELSSIVLCFKEYMKVLMCLRMLLQWYCSRWLPFFLYQLSYHISYRKSVNRIVYYRRVMSVVDVAYLVLLTLFWRSDWVLLGNLTNVQ
jgi:hypothetical protein